MRAKTRFLGLMILLCAIACQKPSDEHRSNPQSKAGSPQPSAPAESNPPIHPPDDRRDENDPFSTAEQAAIPLAQVASLGVGPLPAWPGTLDELHQFVQEARNIRMYSNPNPGDYLRRAPWYNGDGCYAKAAHVSAFAQRRGYPRPGKVLAFGGWATMRYQSPYLPDGVIWWTYHVVAAYHIQSKVYVLDPLVSPNQALSVDDWVRAFAPRPEVISISYCDQNLYNPTDQCVGGRKNGAYLGEIKRLLDQEYRSLQTEGYDPDSIL